MRLVLISNYIPESSQSMLRYAQMLSRILEGRVEEVRVVHPPALVGRLPFLRKHLGYVDKFLLGPWWLRWQCRGADVVHVCDHSNAMYLPCAGRTPALITCHDLIAVRSALGELESIGLRTGITGRILQRWIRSSLARAGYVVCVSAATEKDVLRLASGPHMKMRVVHLPLNRRYAPATTERIRAVRAKFGLGPEDPYFFHVGTNDRYKNREGVLRIVAELRKYPQFQAFRVVLAGKPWTGALSELVGSLGLEGTAIEGGFVTDEELEALYTGAAALLFPSLIEGYGWPPLEAQACGCPVITTHRGSLAEVAGDAAIIIDPDDAAAAAATIAEQWGRREALREAGFRNLERFQEGPFAEAMLRVYEEAATTQRNEAR
ncbi:MAG TPA: glycosyltransferase family 1 protein [Acidobacteriaceae bacterium]|nr:glycosyltransferase family 1 protein [Acidobacteriaceae bacterium]